eukprot:m.147250 g.147250  ORF g.147250 m.147250 type:complete len:656 (+) comp20563_c2_seq1:43-2010(+)
MNPELQEERERATFRTSELTNLLDDGDTVTKERIRALVEADPIFCKRDRMHLNHADQYQRSLQKCIRIEELRKQHRMTQQEEFYLKLFVDEAMAFTLHDVAFLPTLQWQCSEEQKARWLPLAERREIIGCYCQTELGHGSNIRGLETTATFDVEKDCFVLHSPTLTSTKWWPGGLGRTATHAVVYARLLVPAASAADGLRDHGIHPFFVQIRCLKTHTALPGVTVGDIGPKMGYNTVDNGFLAFKNVEIPRDHLLHKTGIVQRNGTYTQPSKKDQFAVYDSMVNIRAMLAATASTQLARAATIAVRYLCVRRQFSFPGDSKERKVLDYPSVQYRVVPWLACAYALHFTGRYMMRLHAAYKQSGDAKLLKEVHSTSSGLKSLCTSMAANGIEQCRLACGGHGYSELSGLPEAYTTYVAVCTAEGDNFLLKQQTTRHLLKSMHAAVTGEALTGSVSYLCDCFTTVANISSASSAQDFLEPQLQLEALRFRATRLLLDLAQNLQTDTENGTLPHDAFIQRGWDVVRVCDAHCTYTMAVSFHTELEKTAASAELLTCLRRVCSLFILYWTEHDVADLLQFGYFSGKQVAMLKSQVHSLLQAVRADAVPLVDAFNLSDHFLNSAIGGHDGKVYETLYDWAQKNPLNTQPPASPFVLASKL